MMKRAKEAGEEAKILKPRVLMYRYGVALGIIFSCILASHIAALGIIGEIKHSSDLISKSINQRAAASNLVSAAEMARTLRTPLSIRNLSIAIDEIEHTHDVLSGEARKDADVRSLYFSGGRGPALDPIMRKFIADARILAEPLSSQAEIDAAMRRMRRIEAAILPSALQEANEGHQLQARGHSNDLSVVQSAAFLIAVSVLLLEAIFIFLPAHRSVSRAISALSENAARLRKARDTLEARNNELEALRCVAEYEAVHDQLTGLANRRGFERHVELLTKNQQGTGNGVAILHIDLDRFKYINDTLGHAAGDAVLQHVGSVLREQTSEGDFAARIGGDEFVVVRASDGGSQALTALAASLVAKLNEPLEIEGSLCQFGASVGVAVGISFDDGRQIDGGRLVANADIALYHAKERGRGRVEFFTEELRVAVEECKTLSDDLALGLGRDEFVPVYQPQIDARTGEVRGVEALARWRHPTRGLLSPAVFLPIADRLRRTGEIDRAIQNQAIQDLRAWDALGLEIPSVSLNVSASRLRDCDLADILREAPDMRGRIKVELLETIFTDRLDDDLKHALDQLHEAEVAVEIDDFGTGHASLLSLLTLRPSRLKIARELIAPLPDSTVHAKLVRSICGIAHSLDIGVTAEGVETAEQRDVLAALECDLFQGYYFARPMPAEALIEFMAERNWRRAG